MDILTNIKLLTVKSHTTGFYTIFPQCIQVDIYALIPIILNLCYFSLMASKVLQV